MFRNFHKNKYDRGVTLIELIVVIAIFVVISGITIFNYGEFNSSLSLQNLADDIALSVRKTQGYAIGVRGYNGIFGKGYGIHFTTNTNTSDLFAGSNKSFILFANINGNDEYNYNSSGTCGSPNSSNECLEVLNITSSDKIYEISVKDSGAEHTVNDGSLDIFFERPNPEPTFCARNSLGGGCNFSNNISYIKIKILNDRSPGVYKTITISNNGQISVSDN